MEQGWSAGQQRRDVNQSCLGGFSRAGQCWAVQRVADRALPHLQSLCSGDPRLLLVAQFNK